MTDSGVAAAFTTMFTDRNLWRWRWHGVEIAKHPLDLAVYQEIIWECRPDVIVESGTFKGGSALFLAEQLDALDQGKVFTIDVAPAGPLPCHPRITYLTGSSIDPLIVSRLKPELAGRSVMVILDSNHSSAHVLAELRAWSPCVSRGQYLIVEDTCINGHPVLPGWGPGPFEAVQEFLKAHGDDFKVDVSREQFVSTFNPSGYLLRL